MKRLSLIACILLFINIATFSVSAVRCGRSSTDDLCVFVQPGECRTKFTYEDAEITCRRTSPDARLCTKDEIDSGYARGAAWASSFQSCRPFYLWRFWTSTPCGNNKFYINTEDGKNESCEEAGEDGEQFTVRCCVPIVNGEVATLPPTMRTRSPTNFPTLIPTKAPVSLKPTDAPTKLPTKAPTRYPTAFPTRSPVSSRPTKAPTQLPTKAPTRYPTAFPTRSPVSSRPTKAPTQLPTKAPTRYPTAFPTRSPVSSKPTNAPTQLPTKAPTRYPTAFPTRSPVSSRPTKAPTQLPTKAPTRYPTAFPTRSPASSRPTKAPTKLPTKAPTRYPTAFPTRSPESSRPTDTPTKLPTKAPTRYPTALPTRSPESSRLTDTPTKLPTKAPTRYPTALPTRSPESSRPTVAPTSLPTEFPTNFPTELPTFVLETRGPTKSPTHQPTNRPTNKPTVNPSPSPSHHPTSAPTAEPTKVGITLEPTSSPQQPLREITNGPTSSPVAAPIVTPQPTQSPVTLHPTASPTEDVTNLPVPDIVVYVTPHGPGSDSTNCGRVKTEPCTSLSIAADQASRLSSLGRIVELVILSDNQVSSGTANLSEDVSFRIENQDGGIIVSGTSTLSTIVGGSGDVRCFSISGIGLFAVRNVKFSGCHKTTNGGAVLFHGPETSNEGEVLTAVLIGVEFEDNSANGNGGALSAIGNTDIAIFNSQFSRNIANTGSGGAIHLANTSRAVLNTCAFVKNVARNGHGGAISITEGNDVLHISSCVFEANEAKNGGGIGVLNSLVSVEQGKFVKQKATKAGGAIYAQCDPDSLPILQPYHVDVATSEFVDSLARADGGHVSLEGCMLHISKCTMKLGTAGLVGGAIVARDDSVLDIEQSSMSENVAGVDGGAIGLLGSSILQLELVQVSENVAQRNGGGVFGHYPTIARLLDGVEVRANVAGHGHGGGIFTWRSIEELDSGSQGVTATESSSLSENRAPNGGGGALYYQKEYVNDADRVLLAKYMFHVDAPERNLMDQDLFEGEFGQNFAKYGANVAGSASQLCAADKSANAPQATATTCESTSLESLTALSRQSNYIVCDQNVYQRGLRVFPGQDLSTAIVYYLRDEFGQVLSGSAVSNDYFLRIELGSDRELYASQDVSFSHTGAMCPMLNVDRKRWTGDLSIRAKLEPAVNRGLFLSGAVLDGPTLPLVWADCSAGAIFDTLTQSCKVCPEGTYKKRSTTGNGGGTETAEAQTSIPPPPSCEPCPKGVECEFGLVKQGVGAWIPPNSSKDGISDVYSCPVRSLCTVNSTFQTACAVGHSGVLCLGCEDGYSRTGVGCLECPSQMEGGWIVFGVLLFWAFVITRLVRLLQPITEQQHGSIFRVTLNERTVRESLDLEVAWAKTTLSVFQVVGLLTLVSVDWPVTLRRSLEVAELLSASGSSLFQCMFTDDDTSSFYLQALFVAFLPLIVAVFAWLMWVLGVAVVLLIGKCRGSKSTPGISLTWLLTVDGLVCSCIVSAWLFYVMQVRTGLQFFTCWSTASAGQRYLMADSDVICWEGSHSGWAIMLGGIVQLGLYGLGVPIMTWFMLYKQMDVTLDMWRPRYGFLHAGYRKSTKYGEVLVFLFKFILCLVVALNESSAESQVLGTLVTVAIALGFHMDFLPYREPVANSFQSICLVVLLVTSSSASFFWVNRESDIHQSVTGSVIGFNVALLLFWFMLLISLNIHRISGNSFLARTGSKLSKMCCCFVLALMRKRQESSFKATTSSAKTAANDSPKPDSQEQGSGKNVSWKSWNIRKGSSFASNRSSPVTKRRASTNNEWGTTGGVAEIDPRLTSELLLKMRSYSTPAKTAVQARTVSRGLGTRNSSRPRRASSHSRTRGYTLDENAEFLDLGRSDSVTSGMSEADQHARRLEQENETLRHELDRLRSVNKGLEKQTKQISSELDYLDSLHKNSLVEAPRLKTLSKSSDSDVKKSMISAA